MRKAGGKSGFFWAPITSCLWVEQVTAGGFSSPILHTVAGGDWSFESDMFSAGLVITQLVNGFDDPPLGDAGQSLCQAPIQGLA
jgi:hypothetical protein